MATQKERSAATRLKLLGATIDSLARLGWSATSTTVIARRAGVSRGAQLHHYPTKRSLVVAAVDHLFDQREQEFRVRFAELEKPGPADAIELLWSMVSSRTFDAWLELVVAARTFARLRPAVAKLTSRFAERIEITFRELFPKASPTMSVDAPFITLALLQGLALDRLALGDDARIRSSIDRYKVLALAALGGHA